MNLNQGEKEMFCDALRKRYQTWSNASDEFIISKFGDGFFWWRLGMESALSHVDSSCHQDIQK